MNYLCKVTLVLAVVSGLNCQGQRAGETAPQQPPGASQVQIPPILPSPPFHGPPRQLPPGAHELQVGSLTGVVLDASGKPAAGVVVSFRPAYNQNLLQPFETNTDQNGRYVVPIRAWDIIASGEMSYTDIMLARDLERNLVAMRNFSWSKTMSNLDLTLQPGITVAGRIKDSQGVPVTNAVVELSAYGDERGVTLPTQENKADGSFAFSAVPPGLSTYAVVATATGYGCVGGHMETGDIKTNRYEFAPLVLPPANR